MHQISKKRIKGIVIDKKEYVYIAGYGEINHKFRSVAKEHRY